MLDIGKEDAPNEINNVDINESECRRNIVEIDKLHGIDKKNKTTINILKGHIHFPVKVGKATCILIATT